jgi:MFS family permease
MRSALWGRLLPESATADARVLLATRGVRAFVDGLVSVVLPSWLVLLGLSGAQIGAVATVTLLGSAALTLGAGLRAHAYRRRVLLQAAALLMIGTGLGFSLSTGFIALLMVGFVGTLNPSGGDVSVFLPTEQALLPATVSDADRTSMFGRYSVVAFSLGAVGSLAAGLVDVAIRRNVDERLAHRFVFLIYALGGAIVLVLYRRLSPSIEPGTAASSALGPSRSIVYRLAATFSLDSFGGGFVIQSMVALWLFRRFDLSVATAGAIFFWTGLLSGASALLAVRIARRIGLIRTMVFTHLPANGFLVAAAFMPNVQLAVACLLVRSALSQMDVPVRSSYVMAVVTPPERAAAASVTNVPRSLAAAIGPFIAGWLLDHSTFGWPLIIGGTLKAAYDLTLLALFKNTLPPEEA